MAALPLNLSGSSVADGSGLYNTALQFGLASNETLNNAFNTFNKIGQQIGDKNVADAWIQAIAAGKSPNEAITLAARAGNSFTSAEALNRLVAQRNLEQDSLRKEALLDINKAQEERAMQNWLGENEAAEANLLLDTGYNTNNSSVFNQGLSKAAELSDKAKKYIKMQNLADQRDKFANSATSRGYTKALTDQIADKKLASKLDADFKMVRAQNPHMPLVQVAQEVGAMNGLSTEDVTRQLNMHQMASGQDILTEQSTNLSSKVSEATDKNYQIAKQEYDNYKINIKDALKGDTEQNKADKNTAIDILSEELTGLADEHPTLKSYDSFTGGAFPSITKVSKDDAKKIISGLLENPTPKKLQEVKDYLTSIGAKGKFVDFLESNFTVENGKVTLAPKTANAIDEALGMQVINIADGKTRKDMLARDAVTMQQLDLSYMREDQKTAFSRLLTLTKIPKHKLTLEQQAELKELAERLNNQSLNIRKREDQVANTLLVQNPIDSLSQTVNTFGELIDSNKQIFVKDLTAKGMKEDVAEDVLERIDDVIEEAQSNEKYKHISKKAIILAVLNKYTKADSWFHTDTDYLKEAELIDLQMFSKESQNTLYDTAIKRKNVGNSTKADMTVNGRAN